MVWGERASARQLCVATVVLLPALIALETTRAFGQYTALDLYTLQTAAGFTAAVPSLGNPSAAGGQVIGYATPSTGPNHAFVWDQTGTPSDLTPVTSPFAWVYVYGCSGTQQVGEGVMSGGEHALIWNGSAASMVDINPAVASSSVCIGTNGTQQVGVGYVNLSYHALLWNGTAQSAVDLGLGIARATDGSVQVGANTDVGNSIACLWHGSASSLTLLGGPAGVDLSSSDALGVGNGQVVGEGWGPGTNNFNHALLWQGAGSLAIDLNPAQLGVISSQAYGTNGSAEVGYGLVDDIAHALLWDGTADSAIDLQLLLAPGFTTSYAVSIDAAGNAFGFAEDPAGDWHAIEWAVPEPSLLAPVLVACLGLRRRFHRQRS